eukprot:113620-Pyramimonas_sp.AAC.1
MPHIHAMPQRRPVIRLKVRRGSDVPQWTRCNSKCSPLPTTAPASLPALHLIGLPGGVRRRQGRRCTDHTWARHAAATAAEPLSWLVKPHGTGVSSRVGGRWPALLDTLEVHVARLDWIRSSVEGSRGREQTFHDFGSRTNELLIRIPHLGTQSNK